MMQRLGQGYNDLYSGVYKGIGSTANAIGKLMLPDSLVAKFGGDVPTKEQEQAAFAPKNTMQTIGKTAEQAGEFMLPGGAEEEAISAAPKLLKGAAKFAVPAISAGTVNKVQGGDFSTGAAAGAGGAVLGEGMRAVAPKLADLALRIAPNQRAFGKTAGRAALDMTSGVRPESIKSSGQASMDNLMNQLEGHVNAASVRPAPRIAGFLPPPRETVDLAPIPGREPASSPMAFNAASDRNTPRIYNQTQFHSGGEHPELSGRVAQPQGTMTRTPEMSASIPPLTEPNAAASLKPARSVLSAAQGKAARQEAGTLHNQLGDMSDFLHVGSVSGEPIPENVTPRKLLDLKRGFSDEHLRWNPNTHETATNAGRGAYHALDSELDRTVPQSADTNQRISSLIEVLRNADKASRTSTAGQRALERVGRHTGAATLGGIGGYEGYREGGIPGAVAGLGAGLLGPELISSPEGEMALARMLNKGKTLRGAVGGGLQLTRKNP
jgi:hypothetical protein